MGAFLGEVFQSRKPNFYLDNREEPIVKGKPLKSFRAGLDSCSGIPLPFEILLVVILPL
jgi:hypothetical protein